MPEINSTSGPVRLLCTGDLHLGRQPSRVPVSRESLSVSHVWQRTIEFAIHERVDAVVLTGDLADQGNALFEAAGPLREGFEALGEANIPVVAVAGNHDYDVLARLHGIRSGRFHLLGAGGTWESVTLDRNGAPVLVLAGWSFPTARVITSPLADYPGFEADVPVVGVLHADLDVPNSVYAPITSAELARTGCAAWLLGHIHRPGPVAGGRALYPGSLQPLDPGEPGVHGPWVVEVSPAGTVRMEPVPLATLMYLEIEVDVTGLGTIDDVRAAVQRSIDDDTAAQARGSATLEQIVYRVTIVGRTNLNREIELLARTSGEIGSSSEQVQATVDVIRRRTLPAHDLSVLSRRKDQPGIASRLLLDLLADAAAGAPVRPEHRTLFDRMQKETTTLYNRQQYSAIADRGPSDEDLRSMAIDQLMLILDGLLAQQPERAVSNVTPEDEPALA